MTEAEAKQEARRRWGAIGSAWESPGQAGGGMKNVGVFDVGSRGFAESHPLGRGITYEQAFEDAQRRVRLSRFGSLFCMLCEYKVPAAQASEGQGAAAAAAAVEAERTGSR